MVYICIVSCTYKTFSELCVNRYTVCDLCVLILWKLQITTAEDFVVHIVKMNYTVMKTQLLRKQNCLYFNTITVDVSNI